MRAKNTLSVFALAMLITGAIDSIRNLPTTALFGPSLIFFFIFSAIVFLIPAALISAELSSTFTQKGGVYNWVKMAFGKHVGVFAIWLQWINTMVWYPTILSFIAGTLTYLLSPKLASNPTYLISVILIVFWSLTFINLFGLHVSTKITSFCAVVGMIIPMALIIALAVIWVAGGHPIQIHFTEANMLPNFHQTHNWISLTAIMTAFLGMELATVHVKNISNAQHVFPKALLVSVTIILVTMILGSLAIAAVLPAKNIHLVDGMMQAFSGFFHAYHLDFLTPVMVVLILIGSLGGMINWVISPAKGLLQAAENGFLPRFLCKQNKHEVAANILLLQAIMVSLLCLAFLLMPSVNGSYWLLTDLSTQLYMLMYVLMFCAAIRLQHKFHDTPKSFTIPGGTAGKWITCLLGLAGCSVTIVIGFFPPGNINVGGFWHYETLFAGGMVAFVLPVFLLYSYRALSKGRHQQ